MSGDGLTGSIGQLNSAIGDLKISIAQLQITIQTMGERDKEDRQQAKDDRDRLRQLEGWRNRVTGGLILVSAAVAALGYLVVDRLFYFKPPGP